MSCLKLINWNIAGMPPLINLNGNPHFRFTGFEKWFYDHPSHFYTLQEVFDFNLQKKIVKFFIKNGYYVVVSDYTSWYKLNGGLLIASKYPIIDCCFYNYMHNCGEDRLGNKGVLWAVVCLPDHQLIEIVNTHLNADPEVWGFRNYTKVQTQQLNEMYSFLSNCKKRIRHLPLKTGIILLAGDFNMSFYRKHFQDFIKKMSENYSILNKELPPPFQIDHILLFVRKNLNMRISNSNLKILSMQKCQSDHEPMCIEIMI